MKKSYKRTLVLLAIFGLMLSNIYGQNALDYVLEFSLGTSFETCKSELKAKKIKLETDKYSFIKYRKSDYRVSMLFDLGLYEVSSVRIFADNQAKEAMEYFNTLLKEIRHKMGESSSRQHKEKVLLRYTWKLEKSTLYLMYDTPENSVSVNLKSTS